MWTPSPSQLTHADANFKLFRCLRMARSQRAWCLGEYQVMCDFSGTRDWNTGSTSCGSVYAMLTLAPQTAVCATASVWKSWWRCLPIPLETFFADFQCLVFIRLEMPLNQLFVEFSERLQESPAPQACWPVPAACPRHSPVHTCATDAFIIPFTLACHFWLFSGFTVWCIVK